MRYDLILKDGLLVSSKGRRAADIALRAGRIAAIAEPGTLLEEAGEVRSLKGLCVLPGLIDAHVHFRDPGFTHKEDFQTGSRSALYGGITYVVDMPNVNPVTSTAERLRQRMASAREKALMDIGFFGLLTADNLDEMEPMKREGAVGFKIYLGTSVGDIAAPPDGVMLEQFQKAAALGMRIGFHAENNDINQWFTQKARLSGGSRADALVEARPDFSEVEAVCRAIAFARETNAAIHIYHVSAAKTVEAIRRAKREGIDITAETCPHYLLLDDSAYARLGPTMKVFPTIKRREDREALWNGLRDGTIDMIATDHAPHAAGEKAGDIWEAMAGCAGVEVSLRLMLTEVNRGTLTLEQLCALMSENPARVWNLAGRGQVIPGEPANLTIVDLHRSGVIRNAELHGKSNLTAFDGTETMGAAVLSVVNGELHELV